MITKGEVVWEEDNSPVVGYKVELWDKDIINDDNIGITYTNSAGIYEIDHPQKTDALWGRGDFYIIIKNHDGEEMFKSSVCDNCSKDTLTINATLGNSIVSGFGVNTVYGSVTLAYPDGNKVPLEGAKVAIKDDDLIFDDLLGETETDSEGNYIVSFKEKDYKRWHEIFEGNADIFASVYIDENRNSGREERFRKIWQTRVFREAILPYQLNIEVPVIHIKGEVASYFRCDYKLKIPRETERSTNDLIVKVYDVDNIFFTSLLGESNVIDNKFDIFLTGSSDFFYEPSGSDIYIKLIDKNDGATVWMSEVFYNRDRGTVIDANNGQPINAIIKCPSKTTQEPQSYSKLLVHNCHIDKKSIDIWLRALNESGQPIGEFVHKGSMPVQYDDYGSCPVDNPPFEITLENGWFEFRATDDSGIKYPTPIIITGNADSEEWLRIRID